jgi:hypothetical protein
MRLCPKPTAGLLAVLIGCSAGSASQVPPKTRYEAIPERNPFGLKPIPVLTQPPVDPPAIPKLTLAGISTISFDHPKAILKALMPPEKAGGPSKEESFILAEGQREGGIEVLRIDDKAETVAVNNFGNQMTLKFEKNQEKNAGGGAPAAGIPVPSAGAIANPGVRPGFRSIPTRLPRGQAQGASVSSMMPPVPSTTAPSSIPSPTGYVTPNVSATTATTAQVQGQLTPEEQSFLNQVEAAVQKPASTVTPIAPPLPGKVLTVPLPQETYLPKKVPILPQ